jgi:hypothetical protein
MKTLHVLQITKIQNGYINCPHCDILQGQIDDHQSGEMYECDNCCNHYTVPVEVFDRRRRNKEGDPIMAELAKLSKRIARLEKEMGIK